MPFFQTRTLNFFYNSPSGFSLYNSSLIINQNQINTKEDAEKIFLPDCIGYISYTTTTGQICYFSINKQFQNKGLGKQILIKIIQDLKLNGNKTIWVISSQTHLFWSNVFNKSFIYNSRPHKSITGSGFSLDFESFDFDKYKFF